VADLIHKAVTTVESEVVLVPIIAIRHLDLLVAVLKVARIRKNNLCLKIIHHQILGILKKDI
jgi:hypothetical protein